MAERTVQAPTRGRGRPADPSRRQRVLDAAVAHVMANGLADLSLRGLASAIGSSPRMLLYDFGSGDELLMAVVNQGREQVVEMVRRQLAEDPSPAAAFATMWQWFVRPENRGYATFAVQARRAVLDGSLPLDQEAQPLLPVVMGLNAPAADHTLVVTVFFGLLEVHLAGREQEADEAMARFQGVLRTS